MQNDDGSKTQKAFIPVGFEDVAISHYSQETARKKIEKKIALLHIEFHRKLKFIPLR